MFLKLRRYQMGINNVSLWICDGIDLTPIVAQRTGFHLSMSVFWSTMIWNSNGLLLFNYNYYSLNVKIACWNIDTLLDLPGSAHLEWCTALICRELSQHNLDIVATSEMRLHDNGQVLESHSSYTLFYEECLPNFRYEAGVQVLCDRISTSFLWLQKGTSYTS